MNKQSKCSTVAPAKPIATVLATADETNGMFAVAAVTLPPHNASAPLHHHERHSEGYYVIDGTLALTQGDHTTTLSSGTSAFVPPGVPHV